MTQTAPQLPGEELALATLLQLGRRSRSASSLAELQFMLVNETHALAPFRQAALWVRGRGVVALSGVVSPEANAPYVLWLQKWFSQHAEDAPTQTDMSLQAESDWSDWLPPRVLTLPLPAGRRFAGGRLLVAREEPFSEGEVALLQEWAEIWSASVGSHSPGGLRGDLAGKGRWRAVRWLGMALALAALLVCASLPVRLTVLAPAELIPLQPAYVRAPLDGVVERVLVVPNQRVKAGEALFEFDRVSLSSRLQVAQRTLATVQAEYRQKAQRALFDPESKSQLAVLQSQIEEKSVEVRYLQALNSRGVATAPRDGVVLFDDPGQWVGRPVVTGERIMLVADEKAVQLEAWLAPADRIDLPNGTAVTFYLAADPVNPIDARLTYVAHEALARPDGQYAYRVRAALTGNAGVQPQVGMKGTAKLEGPTVSAAYWVVRRPWAALRGWLGV